MSTNSNAPPAGAEPRAYVVGDTLVARYRLDALLGEGGIARVYKATNVVVDRLVAIKMLKPEMATNEELVERFLREGRAANRVRHPNVVEVFDVASTEEGIPFMVQELLVGETLFQYMERKARSLTAAQMVDRLIPIVDAIAYAHDCGVVHRDIKPENIYFKHDGDLIVPKILDFGISKVRDQNVRMTATGVVIGTPAYMAPEVIMYDPNADARLDQWSVGIVLYEVLAGRLPFESQSVSALFVEICAKDIAPLRTLAPDVSEELAAVIHKCLEKDPANRFGSMAELSDSLCDAVGIARTGRRRREVFRSIDEPALTEAEMGTATSSKGHQSGAKQPGPQSVRTRVVAGSTPPTTKGITPQGQAGIAQESLATQQSPGLGSKSMIAPIALALAVIGVGGWYAFTKNTPSNTPTQPSVVADAAASTAAAPVRFEIVSHHRGAEVVMRGRTYPAPMVLNVAAATDEETVTIRAPGFAPRTLSLVLDQSMSLTIDLDPVAAEAGDSGNAAGATALLTTANDAGNLLAHVDPANSSGTHPTRNPHSANSNARVLSNGHVVDVPSVQTGQTVQTAQTTPTVQTQQAVPAQNSGPTVNTNSTQQPANTQPTATQVATPVAPVGLTRAQIRQVASTHQSGLQDCADRARSEDPTLSGRLVFRLSIAGTGRTASVVQVGGPTNNAALTHCLTSALGGWQFPATGATANQDFLFPVDLD